MFDVSKRLLKLRKSRGLSQIELAQKVQISSSTLATTKTIWEFLLCQWRSLWLMS